MRKNPANRRCPRCEKVKPRSAFSESPSRPNGLECYCRVCRSKRFKEKYQLPDFRAQNQIRAKEWRLNNPETVRRQQLLYRRTPKGREIARNNSQRWERSEAGKKWRGEERKRTTVKRAARQLVFAAKIVGLLIPAASCELCGLSNATLDAHHHNGYHGWAALDVQWLCRKCHSQIDAHKIKPRKGQPIDPAAA